MTPTSRFLWSSRAHRPRLDCCGLEGLSQEFRFGLPVFREREKKRLLHEELFPFDRSRFLPVDFWRSSGLAELNVPVVLQSVDFATLAGGRDRKTPILG